MDLLRLVGDLIERHGWHVLAELSLLVLVGVLTAVCLVALARGRVRAALCPRCGRLLSRARQRCPRCGAVVGVAP